MAAAQSKAERGRKPGLPAWRVGRKLGRVRITVAVEPAQFDAMLAEAQRRQVERKAGRTDLGELVREALAAWMKRR